jgi:ABC-type glutathione transport system ATPase component
VILETESATKVFRARRGSGQVAAVQDATMKVVPGEFVAIVGESGSGKSTLARMLLGLTPVTTGSVRFDGVALAEMDRAQLRAFRGHVQAVLQDPAGSLNPRKTVGTAIGEIVRLHGVARGRDAVHAKIVEALELVGLAPAEDFLTRYPAQLSGGQRQRVLIARAVVLDPQIIVADEAVSALDASVKAGVLRLMSDLTERLGVGYVFITHDLPVVKKVADRVYVMKSGEIVESGPTEQIFRDPQHPYTQTLLASELVLT